MSVVARVKAVVASVARRGKEAEQKPSTASITYYRSSQVPPPKKRGKK